MVSIDRYYFSEFELISNVVSCIVMCFIVMQVVKHVVSPYLLSLILESWSSKVLVSREYDGICTVGWMVFHLQAFTGMTGTFGHVFRDQTCPLKVIQWKQG